MALLLLFLTFLSVVLCVGGNLLEDEAIIQAAPDHSCDGVQDMLVDWAQVRDDLSVVMEEVVTGGNSVLKYWQHIRPMTHTLDNIAVETSTSVTFSSCRVGFFAVKAFMTAWSPQKEELKRLRFAEDWMWFITLSTESFQQLLFSDWAYVLFTSWQAISTQTEPCEGMCPQLEAFEFLQKGMLAEFLDALVQVDRSDGLGLMRALGTEVPLARLLLAPAAERRAAREQEDIRKKYQTCRFKMCSLREEATPLDSSCSCQKVFPESKAKLHACIFMVDSRPVESLSNITEVLAARFWSLAYEANRLYAEHRGYSIDYIVPEEDQHYKGRKIGWAKVKVIVDAMEIRRPGAERGCDIAVSIDTDAYFRSTESLESVVEHYMQGKDILFSQEYHTEERGEDTHINGGFFIVRNSDNGRRLLREWYEVPVRYKSHATYMKENPQGLNYCWDTIMHPKYKDVTVKAPWEYFSCPRGQYIRHNWFKDLSFEAELQEAVLQRRTELSPGCVLCGEYHMIDMVRRESGKGWINNR